MKPIFRRCSRRRNKSARTEGVFFRKEGQGSFFAPVTPAKTASYMNSLNGGQSLPSSINQFFSRRMGHDFSNVKVHTGKEAANSAKDINARAYTKDNHIVFNEGQYNMNNREGQSLMAHELAHVIQQGKKGQNDNLVDRKTSFKESTKADINIAKNYVEAVQGVGVDNTGITNSFINGHDLTKTTVYPLKVPGEKDITAKLVNGSYESSVKKVPTNTMKVVKHIPFKPKGKEWSFRAKADIFNNILQHQCSGKNVTVYVEGKPDNDTIISSISTHEQVHVGDFKTVYNNNIVTFDTNLKNLKGTGVTARDSKIDLINSITTAAKAAYSKLVADYSAVALQFHQSPAGAAKNFSIPTVDTACKWFRSNITI